jgi:hypothetical protein
MTIDKLPIPSISPLDCATIPNTIRRITAPIGVIRSPLFETLRDGLGHTGAIGQSVVVGGQLVQIVMKDCHVSAVFFQRDATLACYECGRTTSAVVDIGYHGRTATPVYEAYVEQNGIGRTPIGSKAMDELVLEKFKPWSRVASRLCILVLVGGTQQTRDHISLGLAPAMPR